MDDKVKKIYKENLKYSVYGIVIFLVGYLIMFMNEGLDSLLEIFIYPDFYQYSLFFLFLGGLRGFYLSQKLKK